MSDASRPRISWPRRLPPRWVGAVLGVWILAAGGAILLARALDSPVGAGARDEAQPAVPGPVAALDPGASDSEETHLALFPADALPADVAALPKDKRADRLRALIAAGAGERASLLVALGSALQEEGDGAGARAAYLEARRAAPGDLSARVGLAMVLGAEAKPAPARAAAQLAALASANPGSQMVLFNQGLLAVSRKRAGEAREAWNRTVATGPTTRLGVLAARALEALATLQPSP